MLSPEPFPTAGPGQHGSDDDSMARKRKSGFDYIPVPAIDTPEMDALFRTYGHLGLAIWVKTLQEIYRSPNGYLDFSPASQRYQAERCRVTLGQWQQVIAYCVDVVGLFSPDIAAQGKLSRPEILEEFATLERDREAGRRRSARQAERKSQASTTQQENPQADTPAEPPAGSLYAVESRTGPELYAVESRLTQAEPVTNGHASSDKSGNQAGIQQSEFPQAGAENNSAAGENTPGLGLYAVESTAGACYKGFSPIPPLPNNPLGQCDGSETESAPGIARCPSSSDPVLTGSCIDKSYAGARGGSSHQAPAPESGQIPAPDSGPQDGPAPPPGTKPGVSPETPATATAGAETVIQKGPAKPPADKEARARAQTGSRHEFEAAKLAVVLPESLDTEEFRGYWYGWLDIRFLRYKRPVNWEAYLRKQLAALKAEPYPVALCMAERTWRNEWMGICHKPLRSVLAGWVAGRSEPIVDGTGKNYPLDVDYLAPLNKQTKYSSNGTGKPPGLRRDYTNPGFQ